MPKRFTDTDIWKTQRWFKKLSPEYKLVFFYIKDQCNHAGLFKLDVIDLMDDTGVEKFDIFDFLEKCNTDFDKINGDFIVKKRIELLKNNFLWVTNFIQFQYEGKDSFVNLSAPVKTGLQMLSSHKLEKTEKTALAEGLCKGYIRLTEDLHKGIVTLSQKDLTLTENIVTLRQVLDKGYITPKDKDKDKDKYKFIKKGGVGENKKGISFSEDNEFVFFEDGDSQKLGEDQKALLAMGELKAKDVIKGLIN